jgi:hypothetical protein
VSTLDSTPLSVTNKRSQMSGANHMQQRASRAGRVLAAVAAVWLVGFGVLAARHEAGVAHYVDAATGVVFHASVMLGAHTSTQSDVHSSDTGPDHDACGISSAFHQASSPAVAFVHLAIVPITAGAPGVHAARSAVVANQLVYLLAPKTSPPVVARSA